MDLRIAVPWCFIVPFQAFNADYVVNVMLEQGVMLDILGHSRCDRVNGPSAKSTLNHPSLACILQLKQFARLNIDMPVHLVVVTLYRVQPRVAQQK